MTQGINFDNMIVLPKTTPGPGEEGFNPIVVEQNAIPQQPTGECIMDAPQDPSQEQAVDFTTDDINFALNEMEIQAQQMPETVINEIEIQSEETPEVSLNEAEIQNDETPVETSNVIMAGIQNTQDSVDVRERFATLKESKRMTDPQEHAENNRDGEVDFSFQGYRGDCWYLAGLNSLSYSTVGSDIIKHALEYTPDGVKVNFGGGAGSYFISNDEINVAKNSWKYATGDEDVLIFELGYDKFMNSKPMVDPGKSHVAFKSNVKITSDGGGYPDTAFFLLAGKNAGFTDEYDRMNQVLDRLGKDGDYNYAVTAEITNYSGNYPKTAYDVYGHKISLPAHHEYSIVNATQDCVSFTNPHDSSEEIVMDRETFLSLFDSLTYCDLTAPNGPGEEAEMKEKLASGEIVAQNYIG